MAIININANLNGGDVETPDNELFYRIYGDLDGYAAPIHTTGTAIADADVTVADDVVVITSVDGTTNTEFKIAAVDGAGNEGELSDAFKNDVIFGDDFSDESQSKWTKTVENAVDFTMNTSPTTERLNLSALTTVNQAIYSTFMDSIATFTLPTNCVITFGIQSSRADYLDWRFGMTNGTQYVYMQASNTRYNVVLNVEANLTSIVSADTVPGFVYFKIVKTGLNIELFNYDGSWLSLATDTLSADSGDWYAKIMGSGEGVVQGLISDGFYILRNDFSTEQP